MFFLKILMVLAVLAIIFRLLPAVPPEFWKVLLKLLELLPQLLDILQQGVPSTRLGSGIV